ncbi:RBBP8 N-terminal-like protein [Tenrec ecaudatus]|uniref:RBBP8 N-terminal-like protein n=1 Tax=Tenrec ecaudatus TaxID=94439 RepID=UPI003F595F55
MASFMESLNRLKDAHDKELLGLRNKLVELNSERSRDTQRVEELFTKNQQLREQQKALKETVRVLENRLRAGLCDRCMVTQELSRRRQQEFHSSHLQSLQHIFLLTNEMASLKEENKSLREEVKRLRGLEDRSTALSREGPSDLPSPLPLSSLDGGKASTEQSPTGHQEPEAQSPSAETEQLPGSRISPLTKISAGSSLPSPKAPDTSPQCISNQLHGTIAVVRPGTQVYPSDQGTLNGTPPPPARSSPPSPPYEPSLPLDSLLRAPQASVTAFEALTPDRLVLLSRQLVLHPCNPRSSPLTTTAPSGPGPRNQKVTEAKGWEEPSSLLGLPGSLVDGRSPRLESTLHLLLAQQQLRAWVSSARPRSTPPSPPTGSDSEGPEDLEAGGALLTRASQHGGHPLRPPAPRSPPGMAAAQEHAPDKALDLSGWGRGRDAPEPPCCPASLCPSGTPYPESPKGAEPPAQSGALASSPWALRNGVKGAGVPDLEEAPAPVPGLTHTLCPKVSSKEAQRSESDEEAQPDTSDEKFPSAKASAKISSPGEGCQDFCTKEQGQGLQGKRKRTSDSRGKGVLDGAKGGGQVGEGQPPGLPVEAEAEEAS